MYMEVSSGTSFLDTLHWSWSVYELTYSNGVILYF